MNPAADSPGCLLLVATPIGNLDDLSNRAAESLSLADLIACEDTRITSRLLEKLAIEVPLISYREENERVLSSELADQIEGGKKIALVSDAGCPNLSDPGFRLIRECHIRGISVIPVPGANAALCALISSGLPTHQFLYLGFLPKKSAAVKKVLEKWKDFEGSLILYESKYKIEKTLGLINEVFGPERFICLAREITKVHETIRTAKVAEIIEFFRQRSGKGEFTLVIAPEEYSL